MIDTITTDAAAALKHISGSLVALSIQPIGTSWLQAARAAGGDAIALDPMNGSLIGKIDRCRIIVPNNSEAVLTFELALNLYVQWSNESDDVTIAQFGQKSLAKLEQKSKAAGLYYPFVYLNDAGSGENPFSVYGNGKSLPNLRAIRQKYDPTGVFQYLQPGGFKVGL